jgi:hypothetical protein
MRSAAGSQRQSRGFRQPALRVVLGSAQSLRAKEVDIDPLDTELAKQLVAIKWKMTSRGQIAVETKEEMRKRGCAVT